MTGDRGTLVRGGGDRGTLVRGGGDRSTLVRGGGDRGTLVIPANAGIHVASFPAFPAALEGEEEVVASAATEARVHDVVEERAE